MMVKYFYTRETKPDLMKIGDDIVASTMEDKRTLGCTYDVEPKKLTVLFEENLSENDKVKLDAIVAAA